MFKAYSGVVIPQLFGFLSIVFLAIGLLFTGFNIVYVQKSIPLLLEQLLRSPLLLRYVSVSLYNCRMSPLV